MSHRVVFIQGGGIGIDQEAALHRVLNAAGVRLEWQRFEAGLAAIEKKQTPMPRAMLDAVRETGLALKTKLLNPPDGGYPNFNVQLRQELGLFASVRPLQNLNGLPARFRDVNILLVREITEDLYNASEHEIVPGVVQSIKVVTEAACRRFFRFAFELARAHGRKTIHCIHKANILKLADGLFLQVFRQTAKDYPEIQPLEMIVDNACMQLVSKPHKFEVMAAGNLYGDLLSDLGAGLVGGITAAPGINHGDGIRVYEAIHGAARETVGVNKANPLPLLIPALHMLRDLGEAERATRIQGAIEAVLTAGKVRTFDLGDPARADAPASTIEMADAVVAAMGRSA